MTLKKIQQRKKRHKRVRGKIKGDANRPRLSVFRSNQQIYAQVIDDEKGETLAAASTLEPKFLKELKNLNGQEAARKVGLVLAQRALDAGITQVVFDRGGFKYHGRVKALAEGAREGGLRF